MLGFNECYCDDKIKVKSEDGTEITVKVERGNCVIPEGISTIQSFLFYKNFTLTSVQLPSSLTRLCFNAFEYTNISSVLIPNGVTEIGNSCFGNCKQLTSVQLPSTLLKMGDKAFYYTKLYQVTVPKGVSSFLCRVPMFIKDILTKQGVECPHSYEDAEDVRRKEAAIEKLKFEIDIDTMLLIGKYFRTAKDYISVMKVCKKYQKLTEKYISNPISDPMPTSTILPNVDYLFNNIKIQNYYTIRDVFFKREGMSSYVYWFVVSDKMWNERNDTDVFKRGHTNQANMNNSAWNIPTNIRFNQPVLNNPFGPRIINGNPFGQPTRNNNNPFGQPIINGNTFGQPTRNNNNPFGQNHIPQPNIFGGFVQHAPPIISAINADPTEEEINQLGDDLYDYIESLGQYDEEEIGKITEVLLESINYTQLRAKLNNNRQELNRNIEEISNTLNNQN